VVQYTKIKTQAILVDWDYLQTNKCGQSLNGWNHQQQKKMQNSIEQLFFITV
jgi:hypothetical protein